MKRKNNCWIGLFLTIALTAWSCSEDKDPVKTPLEISTKVIANGGAWLRTGAPQNSVASLKAAIQMGVYGSLADVQMSADSVLFVSNADSVGLLVADTTVKKILIEAAPFDSLAKIKLSNGESLPRIQAYLNEAKSQTATRLILKIKPSKVSKSRSLQLARKSVEAVRQAASQSVVDYGSSDYDVCKLIRQLEPGAKVIYLGLGKTPEELAADQISEAGFAVEVYVGDISLIQKAHDKKLTTSTWLVNSTNLMDYLIWNKIDLIVTDEPEILRAKIDKYSGKQLSK